MIDIFLIVAIVLSVILTVIIVLVIVITYKPTLVSKCNTFVPSSKPESFPSFGSSVEFHDGRSPVSKSSRVLFLSRLPTNHWLASTFWSENALVGVYPYLARITSQDYYIDIQGPTSNSSTEVSIGMTGLLHFTFAEPVSSNWLTYIDELSGTFTWTSPSCASMTTPLVRGCPMITNIYQNATPIINSIGWDSSVNSEWTFIGNVPDGEKLLDSVIIQLSNGAIFDIFAMPGIAFNVIRQDNKTIGIMGTSNYTGYIRIGYENTPELRLLYSKTWKTYPTSCVVKLDISDTANITFDWQVRGGSSDNLIMLALPHQNNDYLSGVVDTKILFTAPIMGTCRVVQGSKWVLAENLPQIGFYDKSINVNNSGGFLPVLQDRWESDMMHFATVDITGNNIDIFGELCQSLANMLLVGEQINRQLTSTFASGLSQLEKALDTLPSKLVYDPVWGGIISSSSDNLVDQSTQYYNDHNRYYGNIVYAYAVAGRYDKKWFQSQSNYAISLVRDYMNGSSSDPSFPMYRCKDWYTGLSFNTGLIDPLLGKSQEYPGQAVNAYYAGYLLGLSIGNGDLSRLGSLLMATEIRSVQTYYQLGFDTSLVVSDTIAERSTVTQWGTLSYSYGLPGVCSGDPCAISSVIYPFLSSSNTLILDTWANRVSPLLGNPDGVNGVDESYALMILATIDGNAQNTWANAVKISTSDLLPTNTGTNLLYWIAFQFVSQNM